jgi:hypothetical protein
MFVQAINVPSSRCIGTVNVLEEHRPSVGSKSKAIGNYLSSLLSGDVGAYTSFREGGNTRI